MSNHRKKTHKGAEGGPGPSAYSDQDTPQAPQPQVHRAASRVAPTIPALVLAFFAFAIYFNSLFGKFVSDDEGQVVGNPWIKHLSSIPMAFRTNVWGFQHAGTSNYYRPLMHSVYSLTYQFFGLNPLGYHLVNALFHCWVTILVFLIFRQLLPEHGATPVWLSVPFMAAVLFAAHPIHTEDVAWIAALPDVAFTSFYLLSFYLYIKSRSLASSSYLLSVVSFAVAAFFKEPALTLPLILFAYDSAFREARLSLREYVGQYAPYLTITAAYAALRVHALGGFAPHKTTTLSFYEVALNLFLLFSRYLAKLLWPTNLDYLYVFHPVTSLLEWRTLLSLAVTAIFVLLVIAALKRNRLAFLGLVFVAAPLLPALDIPALGEYPFADRYLYLPSVGFVLLLALFLRWAGKQLPGGSRSIATAFLLLTAIYAVGTVRRNTVWRSNFDLWTDTVAKSPESPWAHENLGRAYRNLRNPVQAIVQYQAAIQIRPEYDSPHVNLAAAYDDLGMVNEAMREIRIAIALDPTNSAAHHNLAIFYNRMGMKERARYELMTALSLKPEDESAQRLLGEVSP
jgi:tetratricopeptide (TPR) repeat protein